MSSHYSPIEIDTYLSAYFWRNAVVPERFSALCTKLLSLCYIAACYMLSDRMHNKNLSQYWLALFTSLKSIDHKSQVIFFAT